MMRSQASYLGCGGKSWLLLSGPKSSLSENKVCISFGNQRPKVWRKNWIDIAWRPVRHFHSQWWFRGQVMLVLVRCVFWSPQSSQPSIPGNDTALRASFGRQALWEMTISFSSRTGHLTTLPKVPKAGSITVALLCSTRRQTWTDGGGGSRGRSGTADPTMQMNQKTAIRATGSSITPEQWHQLHAVLIPNKALSA